MLPGGTASEFTASRLKNREGVMRAYLGEGWWALSRSGGRRLRTPIHCFTNSRLRRFEDGCRGARHTRPVRILQPLLAARADEDGEPYPVFRESKHRIIFGEAQDPPLFALQPCNIPTLNWMARELEVNKAGDLNRYVAHIG